MIQEIRKPVEKYFEQYTQALDKAMYSDNPMLQNIAEHLKKSRGKQLRPLLVLLSAALCGKVTEHSISSAVSLELLHTASLIHDDVVDDAVERRSQPSVKAIWNNKVAILSGDFFLSKVLQIISSIPYAEIIQSIGKLGATLSEGEIEQLSFSKDFSANQEAYFQIIKKKTASLFSTCTYAGALTSGASTELAKQLEIFGGCLGVAFQIKDDIFDYFEHNNIGKPIGNDLSEGKLTLPLIYALAQDNDQAAQYRDFLSTNTQSLSREKVCEIYDFAKAQGGIAYAEQMMESYRQKAIDSLSAFEESPMKTAMLQLLDYCIKRNY